MLVARVLVTLTRTRKPDDASQMHALTSLLPVQACDGARHAGRARADDADTHA